MNDKDTSIKEIRDKIAKFVDDRDWNKSHNPKNLAMSIGIEAAELMEIFQWLSNEEALNISKTKEFIHMKEELSDVIIYCLSMANQLDIDVSAAIEDKIIKNGKKYPVTK